MDEVTGAQLIAEALKSQVCIVLPGCFSKSVFSKFLL